MNEAPVTEHDVDDGPQSVDEINDRLARVESAVGIGPNPGLSSDARKAVLAALRERHGALTTKRQQHADQHRSGSAASSGLDGVVEQHTADALTFEIDLLQREIDRLEPPAAAPQRFAVSEVKPVTCSYRLGPFDVFVQHPGDARGVLELLNAAKEPA